jgi:hypothetical protein
MAYNVGIVVNVRMCGVGKKAHPQNKKGCQLFEADNLYLITD